MRCAEDAGDNDAAGKLHKLLHPERDPTKETEEGAELQPGNNGGEAGGLVDPKKVGESRFAQRVTGTVPLAEAKQFARQLLSN
jgi:hypothetical protein